MMILENWCHLAAIVMVSALMIAYSVKEVMLMVEENRANKNKK